MDGDILAAGLFHETHTFLDTLTGPEAFEYRGYGSKRPADIVGSPMAAALARLRAHGWRVEAGPYFHAVPGGTVADAVTAAWKERFAACWAERERAPKAIFLVLHGAMVSESEPDVEAEAISWIRSLPGASIVPIYAVLDLHGNISARFAEAMNGFLAYRENPHTDACDAAERAVDLLHRGCAEGAVHRTYWRGTPLLWSPSGTATAAAPMRDLEAIAREAEGEPGIAGVNVFAGYCYADMPDAGVTFSVVAESGAAEDRVEAIFDRLEETATGLRHEGVPSGDAPESVLRCLAEAPDGPVLVAEPSDNIGAGAPGDGTGVLRFFLREGVRDSAVILNDPEAVAALAGLPEETVARRSVGGRGSRLDAGPVELDLRLVRFFEGRFDLEDPRSHLASLQGTRVDMGPCVLAESDGVVILLTSRKTPPFDLGQWRVAGIDPAKFRAIGVKAAVAYRRAYDPIAAAHFTLDTPGPCRLDLTGVPFRRIRRPVFPLDPLLLEANAENTL